jgi:hypothetical protein
VPAVGATDDGRTLVPRAMAVLDRVSITITVSAHSGGITPPTVSPGNTFAVVAGLQNMLKRTALWGTVVRVPDRPVIVYHRL